MMLGGVVEVVEVPAHKTKRLTTFPDPGGIPWTFSRVRTGCVRVQRGDFTAYLSSAEAAALANFIWESDANVQAE
jgi:hypothetical protein